MSIVELPLALEFVDFDVERNWIRWVWSLSDDRLSEDIFLHVATDRCGWMERCWHTPIDGLGWDETDEMTEGLPLDDAELVDRLRRAIQGALAPVDLARLLLVHYPPQPLGRAA